MVSTTDSESVSLGSNPNIPAKIWVSSLTCLEHLTENQKEKVRVFPFLPKNSEKIKNLC